MYKLLHHINSAPCFSNLVTTGMALKRYAATRTLGQFSEMIDQSHGIVSSTAGSNYFVAAWPWDVALAPTIQAGQSPAQKMDDFKHVHG